MSGGSVGPRAVTATPHHTTQNNAASSIIPHAAPSAAGMAQPTNKFPMVSASDTDATLAQPPKKKTKRGGGGSLVLSSSAGEYSTANEGLTPEQRRIKHNRERNREHAKNTRIRKKEYVERLKLSVDELCRERDNLVSERATSASLMVEVHSKRVDVLRCFFALRASYSVSQNRELWSSILDESSFTCRLPVTPYQSFPSSEVQVSNCQRTIAGVDSMIGDAAANYVFLDSIVDRGQYPDGKIKFEVVGKRSCSILQQSNSSSDASSASSRSRNRKDMNQLMGPVLFQRPSCAMVVNYTKTGRRYWQYVTIYPLSTDSNVTHYFGLTTFVHWLGQYDKKKEQMTARI